MDFSIHTKKIISYKQSFLYISGPEVSDKNGGESRGAVPYILLTIYNGHIGADVTVITFTISR